MRIGSLFSGAGGLDMAVEESFGGEVIWQSELDKAASTVLAHRFPGVPNLGDITAIGWADVEPVDILCGGFPCQDVSSAGKRAGIKDGTRSGLWAIFADAIDQLRPPLVVIENVRGLLSARAHRNLEPADPTLGDDPDGPVLRAAGAVLGDLAYLGYDAQWATVAASSVGAPHRRERVFILASAPDADAGASRRGHARSGEAAELRQADRTVGHRSRPSATGAPRNGRDEGRPESAEQPRGSDAAVSVDGHVELLPTPTQSDGTGGGIRTGLSWEGTTKSTGDGGNSRLRDVAGLLGPLLPTPQARDFKGTDSEADHNRRSPGMDAVTYHFLPTPQAADSERGSSADIGGIRDSGAKRAIDLTTIVARQLNQWGKYAAAIARWEQIAGPAPAPTEPNRNGKPRLNPAFSEWMMGWPAGWVTDPDIGISRNDQLRIVGNGVCPQQAVAALRFLLSVSEVAA